MKYSIEQINAGSLFRLVFFMILIIFGFFSLIFLIISPFLHLFLFAILIFTVGIPLLALVCGFLAFLKAKLYTAFAMKFGGIVVELKQEKID